jgi:hypothetical protein
MALIRHDHYYRFRSRSRVVPSPSRHGCPSDAHRTWKSVVEVLICKNGRVCHSVARPRLWLIMRGIGLQSSVDRTSIFLGSMVWDFTRLVAIIAVPPSVSTRVTSLSSVLMYLRTNLREISAADYHVFRQAVDENAKRP